MTRQTDSWLAHQGDRLDAIQAAILDLVDIGLTDRPHTSRKPSRREQESTWRSADDYQPTPKGTSPTPVHESDPTGRRVLAWESAVQEAVTVLASCLSELESASHTLYLPVRAAPLEPPTRTTATGRTVIDVAPTVCRRWTLKACGWAVEACARLADRMHRQPDLMATTGHRWRTLLATTLPRLGVEVCACGECGLPAPADGRAKRAACRDRERREREASAA